MRSEGLDGFLITTPKGPSPATRKGSCEMKAIVMVAAVLSAALLTVPTVTQAADYNPSELRLDA